MWQVQEEILSENISNSNKTQFFNFRIHELPRDHVMVRNIQLPEEETKLLKQNQHEYL